MTVEIKNLNTGKITPHKFVTEVYINDEHIRIKFNKTIRFGHKAGMLFPIERYAIENIIT